MEGIHILRRINRRKDLFFIQMAGQRQLNQYAVDLFPAVQLRDKVQQRLPVGIRRQSVLLGVDPEFLTGTVLVADIHLRCGILPYQDHRQAGNDPPGPQGRDLLLQFLPAAGRNLLSVNDLRAHSAAPLSPVWLGCSSWLSRRPWRRLRQCGHGSAVYPHSGQG